MLVSKDERIVALTKLMTSRQLNSERNDLCVSWGVDGWKREKIKLGHMVTRRKATKDLSEFLVLHFLNKLFTEKI